MILKFTRGYQIKDVKWIDITKEKSQAREKRQTKIDFSHEHFEVKN